MTTAAVLNVLVRAQTAAASASLTKFNTQLKSTTATANTATGATSRFGKAAGLAGKVAAGGLAYGLYQGAKAGLTFEKQMSSLGAVADASAKDMKALEKQALTMGKKTAFSANEVAVAQTELAKGGLKVKQIIGGALPASLSLAAAGELELGEAAATTVNAMKLFDLQAKDSAKVADMLATAANTTTADVADFAIALRQGGAAAKLAGLDLNETITILEALAESGVKNSDAGTSMKTALLQLINPTEKQAALAAELGVNFVKANGAMMGGVGIAKQLTTATDGMTQSERAKTFAVLAGTDGIRTLNALYEAGPAKLKGFAKANEEVGTANELAKKKMDNTAGSIEKLKGSLETLAIEGWLAISPAVRDAVDAMDGFIKDFSKDIKNLGFEQAIQNALGKAVKAAAELGAKAAEAFVDAWWHADLLTKLFLTGSFIRLVGGKGAITAIGARLGGFILSGIASVFAVSTGWAAAIIVAPIAGALAGLAFTTTKAFDQMEESVTKITQAPPKMLAIMAAKFHTKFAAIHVTIDQAAKFAKKTQPIWDTFYKHMGDVKAEAFKASMNRIEDSIRDNTSYVKQAGPIWENFYDRLENASLKMAGGTIKNIGNLATAVKGGMENIATNTNEALKGFGVKKIAFSFAKVGDTAAKSFQTGGVIVPGQGDGDKVPAMLEPGEVVWNKKAVAAMGGAQRANAVNSKIPRFATGGIIQQALGPYAMGPIAYDANHAGGNSHLHLDFFTRQQAISIGQQMQKMGWSISEFSGPSSAGFGPVTVTHQSPGHYDGTAFDANTASDETQSEVAAVVRLLGGKGVTGGGGVIGAVAEKIKRTILEGPDGPLKSMGQSSLDKATSAANKFLSIKGPESVGGGVNAVAGAPIKSLPKNLAKWNKQYGYDSTDVMPSGAVQALAAWQGLPSWFWKIAIGESAFQPGAVGHDPGGTTGYGLYQETDPFANAYVKAVTGGLDYNKMLNPVLNTMAAKLHFNAAPSQTPNTAGFPWYGTSGLSSGDYQLGGIVQMLAKGGKAKKPKGPGLDVGAATVIPPGFDVGSATPSLTNKLSGKIADLQNQLLYFDAAFADLQTRAGFSTSEMGSETGPGELNHQVFAENAIINNLRAQVPLIKKGMGMVPKDSGVWKSLNEQLIGLRGPYGSSGRILTEQAVLDGLLSGGASTASTPDNSESMSLLSELLAESQRQNALYRAQMPVWDSLPKFHTGGVVPGSPGQEVPIMATGGEVVSTGGPVVQINFANGMEWLEDFIEVKVDGVNRKTARVADRRTPTRI